MLLLSAGTFILRRGGDSELSSTPDYQLDSRWSTPEYSSGLTIY